MASGSSTSSEVSMGTFVLAGGVTMGINVLLCSCSMLVKYVDIYGGEICLVRGSMQLVIFTVLALLEMRRARRAVVPDVVNHTEVKHEEKKEEVRKQTFPLLLVLLFSLAVGYMTLSNYIGVKLVPVSDFIVLCYTSPVFTFILSAIFLRTRVTVVKASLCTLLTLGVVLVVQPTFLFNASHASDTSNSSLSNSSLSSSGLSNSSSSSSSGPTNNYALGVPVVLSLAFSGSVVYVLVAKLGGRCSNNIMMACSGLGVLVVSFVCPLINVENRLLTALVTLSKSDWLHIMGVSTASMVAGLLIIVASKLAPPTFVVMVRSLELIMAISVEAVILNKLPSLLTLVGSAVVMSCVILMPMADKIDAKLCRRQQQQHDEAHDGDEDGVQEERRRMKEQEAGLIE